MAHIKEPKGVDFIIESKPLTDEERKAISEFIKKDKEKRGKSAKETRSETEKNRKAA
ncbi:MAG TPA: hypothetical protein VEC36_04650 [Patescibacteria group bacterium]|nr:hypothetical protein [Patescibacteria group bacterium]